LVEKSIKYPRPSIQELINFKDVENQLNMFIRFTYSALCLILPLPNPSPEMGGALIQDKCVYFG
jgi:hypothetical protein